MFKHRAFQYQSNLCLPYQFGGPNTCKGSTVSMEPVKWFNSTQGSHFVLYWFQDCLVQYSYLYWFQTALAVGRFAWCNIPIYTGFRLLWRQEGLSGAIFLPQNGLKPKIFFHSIDNCSSSCLLVELKCLSAGLPCNKSNLCHLYQFGGSNVCRGPTHSCQFLFFLRRTFGRTGQI